MKIIGYITVTVLGIIVNVIWGGYVLSILWKWFIVPPFGLPVLTTGQAIGVTCVSAYFLRHVKTDSGSDESDSFGVKLGKSISVGLTYPLVALFIGWIVYSCIS